MEAQTGSALAKATSTKIIDELDQEIAKQKLRPSITKIKLWRHRQHGKTFVNGMNALFNFRKWNTSDNQETKIAAGSQDSSRNLGKQTAAILYVYYDIPNWFSEDELCTLLGYAFRNHNVRQAVYRMVERDMLICKQDTTDTEKYYLSKLPLEMAGRSPEDNPDIERTNPTYAESIEIRKKAGLTLINSRKQLKTPPAKPTNITPLTLADGVLDAQKEDAKRKLDFKQNSKKRSKTTAATASKAQSEVTANSSDSHESDEDHSQSSSSDSSDSEDTDTGETPDSDSEDTDPEDTDPGKKPDEPFKQIILAARNEGTDFNNARFV